MGGMNTRIALITGANRGLGLETARQLGREGIVVVLGCRDPQRGAIAVQQLDAAGISASCVQLDVTDAASIAATAAMIGERHGRLDILVNNAGTLDYAGDSGVETTPTAVFRSVFELNFFGQVAVTQAMLPLIKRSAAGRIVNVTSRLGSISEHADPKSSIYGLRFPAYDASKASLNMYTVELAQHLKNTAIKVNAANPGWVKTDLGGDQAPLTVADGALTIVRLATLAGDGPTGGCFHMDEVMTW